MPVWAQVLLLTAALGSAVGVVWRTIIRPAAKLITGVDEMLPLVRELATVFRDNPSAFRVLDSLAAQFRKDSGSSLRDVIDRLDAAARDNRTAAEVLKVGVEAARVLAEIDRSQIGQLVIAVERLQARLDALHLGRAS